MAGEGLLLRKIQQQPRDGRVDERHQKAREQCPQPQPGQVAGGVGAMAPMPPIWMPIEAKLAKPVRA